MILKLLKEINRKIRSNCTLSFMRYIEFSHLGIFSYFGKGFFIMYEESKKKTKDKCVFSRI